MSEESEAKRIGARLQRNSGRGTWAKGDARLPGYVIDFKEYDKSFTITVDNWSKVSTDAAKVGFDEEPMMIIVLNNDGGKKIRLMVLNEDEGMRLIDNDARTESDGGTE